MATPIIPRMITAPAAPSGFVRTNFTTSSAAVSRRARGAEARAWVSATLVAIRLGGELGQPFPDCPSPVADTGIEPRIGQIDEEVHDHEAERDEEHQGLDDGVVAV